MTKGVSASLALAFSDESIESVKGHTRTENVASLRVMQKCGFTETHSNQSKVVVHSASFEIHREIWIRAQCLATGT